MSEGKGIGGTIKDRPEDFIVKEITSKGRVLEPGKAYTAEELGEEIAIGGRFTTFVLQKTSWDTIAALTVIAKRMGRGRKSIAYAGTKDKISVSTQLASIFGVAPEQLAAVRVKDISINGSWRSSGVEMGANLGNSFDITINNVHEDALESVKNIISELDGRMPNYFDRQRFGSRMNNAAIGIRILNNDFEGAVGRLLTDSSGETNTAAIEARKRLSEEQDYGKALEYFPRHLRSERSMLAYLSQYGNFANAIRKIPRGISIMFIHAVESLIFNMELEERIKGNDFKTRLSCPENFYGFPDIERASGEGEFPLAPLIGYQTGDELIGDYSREALERLGITKESFRIKSMPELSMKGSMRALLSPVKDARSEPHENKIVMKFSIPSGSYATILLNELMKNQGGFDVLV